MRRGQQRGQAGFQVPAMGKLMLSVIVFGHAEWPKKSVLTKPRKSVIRTSDVLKTIRPVKKQWIRLIMLLVAVLARRERTAMPSVYRLCATEHCRILQVELHLQIPTEVLLKMRSKTALPVVVVLITVGFSLACCKPFGAGVTVAVINASGGEIKNLQIKFTGGSRSSPGLKPAESLKIKINPNGESRLVVEFNDSSGKPNSVNVDVYFERNYRGYIYVRIEPGGKATWKDEIKF